MTEPNNQYLIESLAAEVDSLREALDTAMLELSLEDREWRKLLAGSTQEFSKTGIDRIGELSRLMAIKNPLIKRGLGVQADYTFAQGVTIAARLPALVPIVKGFIDRNQDQLFGLQAQTVKDKELSCDGQLFLLLFTDPVTGAVRVRTVPLPQVVEVVTDPEDKATELYYKRSWTQETVNAKTGARETKSRTVYYPDWRYRPITRPSSFGGYDVAWDSPMYHIKVGGFSDWTWGVSEVYAAIDWARAYTAFLEDWATITRALSRFAWKRATRGTARAVQAAKRQMQTTMGTGSYTPETNPPPVVGSVAVMGEGEDLEPFRTAGATTKMEDGRRLLLMVAAAQNLPETFYGDSSVGSLATARSLDRPTELAMKRRQQLWKEIYNNLCLYQIREVIRVNNRTKTNRDLLPLGTITRVDEATESIVWSIDPETGIEVDASIEQTWPAIVEIDPKAEVETIIAASAAIPNPRLIASLILQALRVTDIDDILDELFPEGDTTPSDTPDSGEGSTEDTKGVQNDNQPNPAPGSRGDSEQT